MAANNIFISEFIDQKFSQHQVWILSGRKKLNKTECQTETLLVLNMSVALATLILTRIRNVKITADVGGATVIDGGDM